MRPPPSEKPINVNSMARKIAVDNRLPLRNYYRIADNLLKQASIYREENNVIDLYIILLRYSSLVSETIPFHRDYQVLLPKERAFYKKKSLAVLDELESLQPKFRRLLNELNKAHAGTQEHQFDAQERTSYGSEASLLEWPPVNRKASLSLNNTPSEKHLCLHGSRTIIILKFYRQIQSTHNSGSYLLIYLCQIRKLCLDTLFWAQMVFGVSGWDLAQR
ncbi:hypothetical protein CsSME_00033098 [Camellia sinensis var. sinensis]